MRIKNSLVAGTICLLTMFTAFASIFGGEPLVVTTTGQAYRWDVSQGPVAFNPDGGTLGVLDQAAAVEFLENAFSVWEDVEAASITFTNAGQILDAENSPIDIDGTNYDLVLEEAEDNGQNEMVFDTDGAIFDDLFGPNSGVLGFATPVWATTTEPFFISGGYAFINGAPVDGNEENGEATIGELLSTIVHEIGHFLNLAHSQVNGNAFVAQEDVLGFGPPPMSTVETMYPFAFTEDTTAASLELDDISMLVFLYPAVPAVSANGRFAQIGNGSITGHIYLSDSVTPATGVNVIGRNTSGGAATVFKDAVSQISGAFFEADVPFPSNGLTDPDLNGEYTLYSLTPGADYVVEIDEIGYGGFSSSTLIPLPGPEEFYNGAGESADSTADDPADFEAVVPMAGSPVENIDIIINEAPLKLQLIRFDGTSEFIVNVRSLFTNRQDPSGPNDYAAVRYSIPASVDTPFTVVFGSFLNNDDETVWPRVLLTTANQDGQPNLGTPIAEVNDVSGEELAQLEIPFNVTRTSFEDLYFVVKFPPGEGVSAVGTGPGLAGDVETDYGFIPGNLFSTDGVTFSQNTTTIGMGQFDSFNWDFTLELSPSLFVQDSYEPNNELAAATPISYGQTIKGTIDPRGELDYYTFTGAAGDTIQADVNGIVFGSRIDGYLSLLDANGQVLVIQDDENLGILIDPKLQSILPDNGTYYLVMDTWDNAENGTPTGGPDHFYELTLDTFTPPFEPNDSPEQATPLDTASTFSAAIDLPGDIDFYAFQGSLGYVASIEVELPGFTNFNPVLTVFDTDGSTVLSTANSAFLQAGLAADGTYYVAVTDLDGNGGADYRYDITVTLTFQELTPPLNLQARGGKDRVTLFWDIPGGTESGTLRANSLPVDEVEPNNTAATAQELQGPAPIEVNGTAEVADVGDIDVEFQDGSSDDLEDLFIVTTEEQGLSINLTGNVSDLDIYLLDNPPTTILDGSNGIGLGGETIDIPDLPAGSYIIGVTIYDDGPIGPSTSAYKLTIDGGFGESDVLSYNVYRSVTPGAFENGALAFNVDGSTTTAIDSSLNASTYFYQVTAVYSTGESAPSNEVSAVVTSVEQPGPSVPTSYALDQNFPNPFNPTTLIRYSVPVNHGNKMVKLEIFNVMGQKVRTLVNETQTADFYQVEWDGRNDVGAPVTSGLYLYRITAGSFVESRKMLFIK